MIMKYALVAGWWHHQYLNRFPFNPWQCRWICHWAQHFSGNWMCEGSCAFILWCWGFLVDFSSLVLLYAVRVVVYQTQLVLLYTGKLSSAVPPWWSQMWSSSCLWHNVLWNYITWTKNTSDTVSLQSGGSISPVFSARTCRQWVTEQMF